MKDGRVAAIRNYEQKILDHQQALELIRDIRLDKILHIVYPTWSKECKNSVWSKSGYHDGGYIVIPRAWNVDSLRCQVLAIELPSHEADGITDHPDTVPLKAVRFLSIRSWKLFNKEDAGLYVNWTLTQDFKEIAYSA
jgi:hypothetical protein